MIIKWVRCHTVDAFSFDRGQRGWSDLSGLPGFLGQYGGWSRSQPAIAHLFAWWNSRRDHQRFMNETHDRLAANQVRSYDTVEVRLLEPHLQIGRGFPSDFPPGSVVRLAYCQVTAGRQEHFIRAQANVWNPGMEAAPGMCGGVFARRGQTEFLVLTLWGSIADHERYSADRFPDLRDRSRVADDLENLSGDLVELEPAWTVQP